MDVDWDGIYDNDEDESDDFFLNEDISDKFRLPMTKEQVWEAILDLNRSGQNYIFNKMKKLTQ